MGKLNAFKEVFGGGTHLLIMTLLFLFIVTFLIPVEKLIKRFKVKCTKIHLLILIALFIFVLLFRVSRISFLTQLFLCAICFFGFLFEFFLKKRDLYVLILGSLLLVLILTLTGLKDIADRFSAILYLIIAVGALKAIFYDKIFK